MATKRIILEDGSLRNLATRPDVIAEFPFLKSAGIALPTTERKQRRCGRCNRQVAAGTRDLMSQIKRTLVAMSAQKKRRLKELLDTESIQISFRDAKGKVRTQII